MSDKLAKTESEIVAEDFSQNLVEEMQVSTAIETEGDFADKLSKATTPVAHPSTELSLTKPTKPAGRKRRWQVGFGPVGVPPFSQVEFAQQVQAVFRGEKLINTGNTSGLLITDLFIGQKPQISKPVDVGYFQPNVLSSEFNMDVVQPAMAITFRIQNPSAATLTWSASMFGSVFL